MVVLLLAGATRAGAQTAAGPLFRADVSGSLGWFNADKAEINASDGSNDWYNRSVYGGAGFAWYWTDHWKTEIEGGASSAADLRATPRRSSTAARPRSIPTIRFSTRRLAIGQQYQFYRNVWVHPFVRRDST